MFSDSRSRPRHRGGRHLCGRGQLISQISVRFVTKPAILHKSALVGAARPLWNMTLCECECVICLIFGIHSFWLSGETTSPTYSPREKTITAAYSSAAIYWCTHRDTPPFLCRIHLRTNASCPLFFPFFFLPRQLVQDCFFFSHKWMKNLCCGVCVCACMCSKRAEKTGS